jgi:hypothetical protein
MSILGLSISIVLALITLLIVVYPLVRQASSQTTSNTRLQQQRDRALAYYDRVLTNILDLDEDFSTEKIKEADHQQERDVWVHRGIRLLRVLDQLDAEHSLVDSQGSDIASIDEAIEEAIKAYRDGDQPAYHELAQAGNTST